MLAAFLFLLPAWSLFGSEEWKGWVYPNREDLTKSTEIGPFDTFEKCQQAAVDAVNALSDPKRADYECGLNCRFEANWKTNICKETRK